MVVGKADVEATGVADACESDLEEFATPVGDRLLVPDAVFCSACLCIFCADVGGGDNDRG